MLVKTEAVTVGCSIRKGVLRNFLKFTGKRLCQGLFLKRDFGTGVFFSEFCEISENTVFPEHLWAAASIRKPAVKQKSKRKNKGD